jgi:competence protein ComEC
MSRFPALVLTLAWSITLAGTVVLAPMQPWLGALAVGLAIPCLALVLVLRPAVIALAIVVALLGVARAELPAADPWVAARALAAAGKVATFTGIVADDSRPAAGGAEVIVEPQLLLIDGAGRVSIGSLLVRWRGPELAGFGDTVQATGKLVLPRDLPTFDRRAYLAQRHAYLELEATSIDVTRPASGPLAWPGWLRSSYIATVDQVLPAPHAAVLLGVVLGIRQGIPPSLDRALIETGLIHLLVLSGLKVAVFARMVQAVLHPLLGRHAAWPALCLIGLYALAGGATPAAVRAAVMGGLVILAASLGRPSHVWTSLAVTAAGMLGWRPDLAWDVGFQLSFAGTAAIILLTPAIEKRFRWLPAPVREPFAVTCAAQVGTLPMMATDFHTLSLVGPIANALVLPLLPALVAAGLALGPLAVVPDMARAAALPITGLVAYLEQVANVLARVPLAAIPVARFPTWAGLAYYASLGAVLTSMHLKTRSRRNAAIATGLIAPLLIAATALGAWANAPATAYVLAVGDGQAVLFRGPQGAVLVDGGPSPALLRDGLGQLLPPWQRGLDGLAITAPSLGHVGGLAAFDRPAAQLILPATQLSGAAWRSAALEALARGANLVRVSAGSAIRVAGFIFQVLSPDSGAPGDDTGAANLALRVVAPSGRSFCDLSDLDLDAQAIAASHLRGGCTYLLVPGGAKSRLSPELLAAAGDTQMVVSRLPGRLALGYPLDVLRTDQEGTVTLPM